MAGRLCVTADWGTSNLRLYLLEKSESEYRLLDSKTGPGVSQVNGNFAEVFFSLTQDWLSKSEDIPIIISGMIGSSIGWRETPYLSCPVDAEKIAAGLVPFISRGQRINIISGLSTNNPLGHPDVMRGEELQLLGWIKDNPNGSSESRLFILPGTHNKWVLMRKGEIHTFLTAMTGELFSVLRQNSVLLTQKTFAKLNVDAFVRGLKAQNLDDASTLLSLFTTRSLQLLGDLDPEHAASYLSGLLIGADVTAGYRLFKKHFPELEGATLIGDSELAECYQLAFEHHGIALDVCDSTQVTLAGYEAVIEQLGIDQSCPS